MKSAFLFTGSATVNLTALTDRTNVTVKTSNAERDSSNVLEQRRVPSVCPASRYVTVMKTVLEDTTRLPANCPVVRTHSNAMTRANACPPRGSVTAIMTAQTVPMKTPCTVTIKSAMKSHSSNVTTANAFLSYGSAILTMIVETRVTNQRTCAGTATARPDGRSVPQEATTDACPRGSSVTAKTTAETTLTRPTLSSVLSVIPQETSSVRTTVAFL